jgi:tetratricopeptide (TPR) repeat protein
MMKFFAVRGLLLSMAALLTVATLRAQNYTVAETKAFEKSKTYYDKQKYDKAITTLNKVLYAHVHDEQLWQYRVLYEKARYDDAFAADIRYISKEMSKNPDGAVIQQEKLQSPKFQDEMLFACYGATLYAPHQDLASLMLHKHYIEPAVDTLINKEAEALFNDALVAQNEKNNSEAIRLFEKAYRADTTYYSAAANLGYAYYQDDKFEKAVEWFRIATRLQPEMLEPRFYTVEIYIDQKNWQKAYDACLDAMIQYPFTGYTTRMERICENLDKTYKSHWMERVDFPSVITIQNQTEATGEPWKFYSAAKEKILGYCGEDGVVKKSNTLTEAKYLEVYSWEYMLKKSDYSDKEFGFARRCQEQGYLDCFALFSMYHITFREQYHHFRDNNREKLKGYIESQLVR